MNRLSILVIAGLLTTCIALLCTGCKKYDDGPLISLRTKKKRLVGQWETVAIDGTSPINAMYHEFKEDGKYIYTETDKQSGQVQTVEGTWELDNYKETIYLSLPGKFTADIRRILRLTSRKLWYLRPVSSEPVHEDHLEKR